MDVVANSRTRGSQFTHLSDENVVEWFPRNKYPILVHITTWTHLYMVANGSHSIHFLGWGGSCMRKIITASDESIKIRTGFRQLNKSVMIKNKSMRGVNAY